MLSKKASFIILVLFCSFFSSAIKLSFFPNVKAVPSGGSWYKMQPDTHTGYSMYPGNAMSLYNACRTWGLAGYDIVSVKDYFNKVLPNDGGDFGDGRLAYTSSDNFNAHWNYSVSGSPSESDANYTTSENAAGSAGSGHLYINGTGKAEVGLNRTSDIAYGNSYDFYGGRLTLDLNRWQELYKVAWYGDSFNGNVSLGVEFKFESGLKWVVYTSNGTTGYSNSSTTTYYETLLSWHDETPLLNMSEWLWFYDDGGIDTSVLEFNITRTYIDTWNQTIYLTDKLYDILFFVESFDSGSWIDCYVDVAWWYAMSSWDAYLADIALAATDWSLTILPSLEVTLGIGLNQMVAFNLDTHSGIEYDGSLEDYLALPDIVEDNGGIAFLEELYVDPDGDIYVDPAHDPSLDEWLGLGFSGSFITNNGWDNALYTIDSENRDETMWYLRGSDIRFDYETEAYDASYAWVYIEGSVTAAKVEAAILEGKFETVITPGTTENNDDLKAEDFTIENEIMGEYTPLSNHTLIINITCSETINTVTLYKNGTSIREWTPGGTEFNTSLTILNSDIYRLEAVSNYTLFTMPFLVDLEVWSSPMGRIINDVKDHSFYLNNASLSGCSDVAGYFGRGIDFNGFSDYIKIPNHDSLNFTFQNFTIMGWAKLSDLTNVTLINKGGWGIAGYMIWINADQRLELITSQSGATQRTKSNIALSLNTWFHFAVVRQGSSASIYLDGDNETYSQASITDPLFTSDYVYLGAYPTASFGKTKGVLDEVRFYSEALTESQIETLSLTEVETLPYNLDVSITNMDGENTVFSGDKYYVFEAIYGHDGGSTRFDFTQLKFTDGVNLIQSAYDNQDSSGVLVDGGDRAILSMGTVSTTENNFTVSYKIMLKSTILDAFDVSISIWSNDTSENIASWVIKASSYFDIYNSGGLSLLRKSGDAGRLTGGDAFDLYAYNGSWVESTLIFNNLQHVKLLPMLEWNNTGGVDEGNVALNYTISYFVDGNWTQGWSLILHEPNAFTLRGANPVREVSCNVFAYQKGNYVKSYGFHPFFEYTDTAECNYMSQFWVDLWFNKLNASSIGGARVNAYYFPMQDNSHSLFRWLTGSNWGLAENVTKEFMYFDNLLDANNEILYAQEIELIKLSCRLSVTAGLSNYVQITNHQVFDLTLGPTNPFRGVQTPVFDETKVPDMPQGGFLGALWSHLTGVFNWIVEAVGPALLEFFDLFVGFMDSIAAFFGAPGLFSLILGLFGNFWGWFTDAIVWSVGLITTGMTVATLTMAKFGNAVATIVGQWVAMIQAFFNFLGGSYSAGINVWSDLGLSTWLLLGAILYPLYLMEVAATKGIDAAISQVEFLINIGAFIVSGLLTIVKMAINLIVRVIESIPVVE